MDAPPVIVIKKNGDRERFNPEKIRRGVRTSCKNRPVSELQIDEIVSEVEQRVYQLGDDEVSSRAIGDFVRDALRPIDEIAYVRFVSVYQAFSNIEQFSQTIDKLPNPPKEQPHAAAK
jgi:transcriptional repressor NrdR